MRVFWKTIFTKITCIQTKHKGQKFETQIIYLTGKCTYSVENI